MPKAKYKKRKDGRYQAYVVAGRTDDGKPRRQYVYAHTVAELESQLAQLRVNAARGIVVDDKNLTVSEWADKWVSLYKTDVGYNTREMYDNALKHIKTELGDIRLKELKKHHVQQLVNLKAKEGYTRTVEIMLQALKQMLNIAMEDEFVYKNAAETVRMPEVKHESRKPLNTQDKNLIDKTELSMKTKAFVYLLLYTGLRRGEALALLKNDVDLVAGEIAVNKTVIFKGNNPEIKYTPKTDAGVRRVPILDALRPILTSYMDSEAAIYLFPSQDGEPMSKSGFRKFWDAFEKRLNLAAGGINGKKAIKVAPHLTPHMFRHTYATTLYYAGVDVKTAQYLLGHKSVQMTLDLYTHLEAESKVTAKEKLNNYINGKVSKGCQTDENAKQA